MSAATLHERIEQLRSELEDANAQIEELKTQNERLEEQVWDLTHDEESTSTIPLPPVNNPQDFQLDRELF